MQKTILRDFNIGDEKRMLLIYESQKGCFEDIGVTEAFLVHCAQRPDFDFLLAEYQKNIMGFAGCLVHENVARAEIGPIAVDSRFQGMGAGSALESAMRQSLSQRGVKRVIARVKSSNNRGIRFFLGRGYSFEAVFKKYTPESEDIIQMVTYIR